MYEKQVKYIVSEHFTVKFGIFLDYVSRWRYVSYKTYLLLKIKSKENWMNDGGQVFLNISL